MAQTRLVPADLEGPVDRAVRSLFGTSWGKARGWIEGGKVRVGGALVTDATARVPAGAEIARRRGGPQAAAPRSSRDGDVVYADAQVVVVAKPAGLSTIPYDGTEVDTLDARVRALARAQAPRRRGASARRSASCTASTRRRAAWSSSRARGSPSRRSPRSSGTTRCTGGTSRSRTATCPTRTLRSFFIENRGDGLRGSARGPGARPPADGARGHHARRRASSRSRARRSSRAGSRRAARTRSGST